MEREHGGRGIERRLCVWNLEQGWGATAQEPGSCGASHGPPPAAGAQTVEVGVHCTSSSAFASLAFSAQSPESLLTLHLPPHSPHPWAPAMVSCSSPWITSPLSLPLCHGYSHLSLRHCSSQSYASFSQSELAFLFLYSPRTSCSVVAIIMFCLLFIFSCVSI